MRGQLDDIADDDRLTPDSRAIVEWFAEQVKAATTGQRLDDLADLFGAEKIRRHHWWQGQPAAITAGYAEDDDGQDDDEWDDDEWDDDEWDDGDVPGTAVVLATPARIAAPQRRATWAEALRELRWRLQPMTQWSGCQVVTADGHLCADPRTTQHVGPADQMGGWVCDPHYAPLAAMLSTINQARGFQ
jgi:hypothetical protein